MAQYLVEFDGNKYIIQAANLSAAKMIFINSLEFEDIIQISKIIVKDDKKIKMTSGKRFNVQMPEQKHKMYKGTKMNITNILSKRDKSLSIETREKR